MKRIVVCLAVCGLAACNDSSSSGDDVAADAATTLQPSESCERYLSCVLVAAPQSYAAQLALYGSSSECWKTPQQTANCGQACDAAFEDIANQCTCVGTTCMPPTCGDSHEPNEDIQHAKPTGTGADGSLCPATDIDVYSLAVGNNITLTAHAMYTSGGPLQLSVLNPGGIAIANGAPQSDGVRAQAANLPSGTYYVKITGSQKADYHLAITMQ